jgi:23S rRNA (adenine1618-N6)-methyltransferase
VKKNPKGTKTVDFSDSKAVVELNKSLLMQYYGVTAWEIPKGYLCPPIPGRADYVHYLADLIMAKGIKRQDFDKVKVLDVGTGASAIYPIIGMAEYGWTFTGTEVDPVSIKNVLGLKSANASLENLTLVEQQSHSIFNGVIKRNDYFHLTMCNPPFHASFEESLKGTQRKNTNLRTSKDSSKKGDTLNFGGQNSELWCEGGELGFVRRMIRESVEYTDQVGWFTCLISKKENLSPLRKTLKKMDVKEIKTVTMSQGQKVSRFLAWTYRKNIRVS